MMTILHLDASARSARSDHPGHGSRTRRLTARFVRQWHAARPQDVIIHRDVGQHPPHAVTEKWIHTAFTKPQRRERWMNETLAESDSLVDELVRADLIVAGVPMYNFGV